MDVRDVDQRNQNSRGFLSWVLNATTIIVLFGVMWRLVDHYSVNVLYWDQWDMLGPLFRGEGLFAEFRYQHGPHRLGLGGLFTHFVYAFSHWNTRTESYATLVLVSAATILALLLYRRLLGQLHPYAVIIPAAMLSLTTFEVYTSASNPSHGAVPLLLAVIICWVVTAEDSWVRSISLVLLTLGIIHTGFGILYGPLLLVIGLAECVVVRPFSRRKIATFCGLCLAVGFVFLGYVKNDASGCSPDIVPVADEYARFAFLLLTKTLGNSVNTAPTVYTLGIPVLILWIVCVLRAAVWGWQELRRGQSSLGVIATMLIAYSLIFVAMSALGRTCTGVFYGGSSRYQIHLAPAYLGIALVLGRGSERLSLRLLQLLIFALLLWGGVRALQVDEFGLQAPRNVRLEAKNCLLQKNDAGYCFSHLDNFLYPVPHRVQMAERLAWLKANKLNLYLDAE